MATRQNKKRKGRNPLPRERTVTTLTDGTDGPFISSPVDDYPSASLMSSPFAVSTPITTAAQPPGISPAPFPIPPFSAPFSYSFSHIPSVMPSIGGPFQQQHPQPQFFLPATQQQSPVSNQSQQQLPPGENDLEILERLKETIKSNHHEFFRPVPQPAALASIYLGTKSLSAPSHVPPHPEQVPTDPSPPGLTLTVQDAPKLHADALSAHPSTSSTVVVQPTPDLRDVPRKAPHRLSVSESPKTNAASPVKRYDSTANAVSAAPPSKIERPEASPRMGPPASLGRPGEIVQSPVSSVPAKIPPPDSKEDLRPKDSTYARGYDDRDRPSISDSRGPPPRSRSIDRERERERERSRDRDYDRDRDRRLDYSRYRDDRRPDDRRPPPPNDRRYEARYTSARGRDERNIEPRPPPRNLGEERAIIRPPVNASVPPVTEDRATRPPPADDRRAPLSPPNAERRPSDDRRPPPPAERMDRLEDRRPLPPVDRLEDRRPMPPPVIDRPDDRRPLPPPVLDRPDDRRPSTLDRPDDRRRPPSPAGSDRSRRPLPLDERRPPPPPSRALSVERTVRHPDDRRPPVPPVGDRPPLTHDDRRPPAPPAVPDRSARPEDRRQPVLEERISRAPVPASTESVPARPPLAEERSARPTQPDERNIRPVPLEERISRVPSLQERLSYPPPARPDDKPAPRLEERLGRPATQPPSLEERLSNPPASDTRPLRPLPDDRPARLPPPADRPVGRTDDRSVLAEPARAPPAAERPPLAPEDRHYAPAGAGRFPRPPSPAVSDRGAPPRSYRASSVARDDPRSYRPASPARSEYRPAGELRDRAERPPYRPEPDRYPADRDRRPDPMDVDPPRFSDRASYRRPSPPPADAYAPPRDRTWVPAGEAPPYRDSDREPPPRRPPPGDTHGYTREWREGDRERPYGDDYDRSWDRSRDYDRDGRFPDRDPAWETREERDRRPAYPPPPPDVTPASSRPYEPQRPLSSRLSDAYPDDRGYSRDVDRDRGRFPPSDPPPFSRVRPRSPSPVRRSTANDDLRPPLKRAREDPYPSGGYYPPGDEPRRPSDFPPPRLRTPPPSGGGYYDDPRYNTSPGAPPRDRDFLDRERDVGYAYDRRADPRDPPGRLPPPRSPPPYGRSAYDRDDRRYSIPPRP
ncbi:hypothetical protein K466DRAFT_666461 [Polyporus arcularius HHB13444]|uniref:Uncharacterized protein n=1 Tax=Polyporus arcularius HHB13444 TaxID=1314778 RepID=A0A5C3P0L3_9APHY|nr:hypothetical protein K466DRAFT_666461 [Polyporus arcularius HHB13444]